MSETAGIVVHSPPKVSAEPETPVPAQLHLRQMVLDSVTSPHSRRNYAKALDLLFAFAGGRRLTRALLLEYRSSMEDLAPSTINVRLAAVRKMVNEAKRNGMLSVEEAASITDVPNIGQSGKRLGNWLTKEQARELLAVPDRSTVMGKRDYAILALLVGCALRRRELASLTVEEIQMRENRWIIADLRGKGGRVRTVAVPMWVKQGINAWQAAGGVEEGPLFRSIRKGGKVGESLSDWAVWAVVKEAAKEIGIEKLRCPRSATHLREALPQGRGRPGADQVLAGTLVNQTTERYLGSEQEIAVAVNDGIGL